MLRAIVTCGPAYEPIDNVRRITNHATGEIGTLLSDALTHAGFSVVCFRGELATHPLLPRLARVIPFSTNGDLLESLEASDPATAVVFHAAALCDFQVTSVRVNGSEAAGAKLSSSASRIDLTLEPAPKILPELRRIFPRAKVVSWKYELEGDRDAAIARAVAQLTAGYADASVVNGSAYGPGFGFCEAGSWRVHFERKEALAECLAGWADGMNA